MYKGQDSGQHWSTTLCHGDEGRKDNQVTKGLSGYSSPSYEQLRKTVRMELTDITDNYHLKSISEFMGRRLIIHDTLKDNTIAMKLCYSQSLLEISRFALDKVSISTVQEAVTDILSAESQHKLPLMLIP